MLKMVPETPLLFGVAERLSQTFRAESTKIRVEAPKMLWADSVSTAYLIYRIPYVPIGLRIPEEEWRGKDTSYGSDEIGYRFWDSKSHKVVRSRDVTFNEDSLYGAKVATDSSNLTKLNQKDQVVLEDSPENLAENDSIVAEHGLSSKITHSPGGSSDTSEGSENSGSFEDSRRSDEEDSKDRASSKEGGSETPQLRRSTRESRAPVRYSPSSNYLLLTKNELDLVLSHNISRKEGITKLVDVQAQKQGFSDSWAGRKPRVQIEGNSVRTDSSTEAMVDDLLVAGSDMAEFNKPKWQLPLVFEMKDRCSEKQVGVLPERGYSQFNDVSLGYLVAQPQVNPDSTIAQVEHITPFTLCGTGVHRLYNMLSHVSLEGRHIVVLGLRGGLLGANPIQHW
ncbi:hypothetical protein Tco_1381989 [Tanacetum coccineum]